MDDKMKERLDKMVTKGKVILSTGKKDKRCKECCNYDEVCGFCLESGEDINPDHKICDYYKEWKNG